MKKYFLSLLLILGIQYSFSQGLFESASLQSTSDKSGSYTLNGYVRGSSFLATEKYDYPSVFGEVSLQTHLSNNLLLFHSDLRFRSGSIFDNFINEFELKEAYAGVSTNFIDVFLGNQIVSWGRTDGFNPTNNITPKKYFFLSANPDDQNISNFMLKTNFRFSPLINLEFIGIPVFKPSEYRYDLLLNNESTSFSDAVLPKKSFNNGSLAAKLNFELPSIGFSLSWFNGYDPFYGFDIKNIDFSTGIPAIDYMPSFYRKNSLGLDFALPVGTWIVKGEGAYNIPEDNEGKMYIPNKDISYVIGIEHDIKGFTTIVQYIGKYTLDLKKLEKPQLIDLLNPLKVMEYATETIIYESALYNRKIFHQQKKLNHAVSLIITKSFAYEIINIELSGFYDLTSNEYLVRPSLKWNISNSLSLTAGYSYMNGPVNSLFKYASPILSGGFVELKASF